MNISFKNKRTTVVVCPYDMRQGYSKLSMVALMELGIDVSRGEDIVVFFSASRGVCKVITADDKGALLIVRKLKRGRFEKLLMREDGEAKMEVEIEELSKLLDGGEIFIQRTNYLAG